MIHYISNKLDIYKIILVSVFLSLLSIGFFSCNILKKPSYDPMPDWVIRKPQSSMYYTGVSSATKPGFSPSEYITSAQQRALGDLASSISVNIESSSMLSIIEIDYNISENFSRDITASTSKELEGYELVDTWEDETNYWVYYRLSREKYHRLRQEKKNTAIRNAENKVLQAHHMLDRNSHYNALQFYADALSDLKIYLGESTPTKINDKEVDLGNYIFAEMADFINNLKITYPYNQINVQRGVEINPDLLTFKIVDKHGNPVSNIPVRINFTGAGLLRNSEVSGTDGKVVSSIRRISSSRTSETLSLTIDMNALSRVTSDPMIRNIIRNMPAPERSIRVVLEKPVAYITATEMELNKLSSHQTLYNALVGNLGRDFDITEDREKADYIISINSNTSIKGTYLQEHYVTMSCRIDMTDVLGNNLYRRTIEADHMGPDFLNASRAAYQATSRTIERSIIRDIVNSIN